MTDVMDCAAALVDDNRHRRAFAPPWGAQPPTLDEAYRIQDAVLDGLAAERGPLGGYKIALTAEPLQRLMGLTEPLGGLVHAGEIHPSPHLLSLADFHSPAVEFEVAVRIGSDVPPASEPWTGERIAGHVGEVMTSFEIVDTRGADLSTLGPLGLVADRCLCSGMVLGDGIDDWAALDLGGCAVEVEWNGQIVERGSTGAAMGHPFTGLAWVANHLVQRKRRLDAGHIVLTGSTFAPRPVAVGDRVTYRIDGIGEASIEVTP